MSSSDLRQQQRIMQAERNKLSEALESQRNTEMETLDTDQELTNEKAARLQAHSGNEAIQDLIDQLSNLDQVLTDLETELEIEEKKENDEAETEVDEGEEIDVDSTFQQRGGGDGGGSDDDPWEQEFFYGGNDDPVMIKRKRKKRRRRTDFLSAEPEEQKNQLGKASNAAINLLLPTPAQGQRTFDSRYQAVELAMLDASLLSGGSLNPDDLKQRKGVKDPIRLPVEIGRFLEKHGTDTTQAIGELCGGPAASLVVPQGGFSGAVSRLATLAVCAEASHQANRDIEHAEDTEVRAVDRSVELSLRYDCWHRSIDVARLLSQQGQLHAPRIAAELVDLPMRSESSPLPRANPLGAAALRQILPAPMPILKPTLNERKEHRPSGDASVDDIDRLIAQLTGATNPFLERPTDFQADELQPALQSTNQILSALGRAQVEIGAAAAAIVTVLPTANIHVAIDHGDKILRQLARTAVISGQQLEGLIGRDRAEKAESLERAITALNECIQSLRTLNNWMLTTLTGALYSSPPEQSEC